MIRTKQALVILFGIITASAGFSEEYNLKEIVETVLKNDESLKIAEESIEAAYQGYRITRAQGYPQITLSTDPIYGAGMRRAYSFEEFPPEFRTTLSHSFSLGVGLSQLLPTGGVVSAKIDDTFQYNIQLAEDDLEQTTSLIQQPGFSLHYNQPLFVNGKLIDGQLMNSTNQSADLQWRSSKEAARGTKNAVLLRAAQLYVQLFSIELNKQFLQESLSLAQDQLNQTTIDRDQGRASANQVLGLEVAVNRQREAMLDFELSRMQIEHQLGRMLGDFHFFVSANSLPIEELLSFAEDYLLNNIGLDSVKTAAIGNPDITAKRFDRESKRLQALLHDTENAPNMSLFLTLNPRYPDERENDESFSASFSDFFNDGAGVDFNFGLSFQVPITDGGLREAGRKSDAVNLRIADLNIAAAENAVAEKVLIAQKKDEIFRKRIELQEVDKEYQQNRLEREERLASLNTSTKLKVDTIHLDLLSIENQLWQTRVDIFLNLLELISLSGKPLEEVLLR